MIKGILDKIAAGRKLNDAQKARYENNGVLLASGLSAGEALIGLVFAGMAVFEVNFESWLPGILSAFPLPFAVSSLVFVVVAWVLIRTPLANAGRADEPAPPSAMV